MLKNKIHTKKRVPKLESFVRSRPRITKEEELVETNHLAVSCTIPTSITPSLERIMKKASNPYCPPAQPFYFLLYYLPDAALSILFNEGILEKEDFSYRNRGKLEITFSETLGYFPRNFNLNERLYSSILSEATPIFVSEELSDRLLQVSMGYPQALKALKSLGAYISEDTLFPAETLVTSEFGVELDQESYAMSSLLKSPKYGKVRRKLWRSKDESKFPFKRRNLKPSKVEPKFEYDTETGIKVLNRRKQAIAVQDYERYISDFHSLRKACIYVSEGSAKTQFFHHPDEILNIPVQIVLNYILSRYDRNLIVDIDKILNLDNPVVNYRLSKWEQETNKGIISIKHFFGGRFYDYRRSMKSDMQEMVITEDTEEPIVYVSKKYMVNPEHYITCQQELDTAVARILMGTISIGDFCILDPKTEIILTYAQDIHDLGDGSTDIKPEEISWIKIPELRKNLESHGLLNTHYKYAFRS
ncbi:MAG: hypothetical protein ABIJ34_08385 [archaeon]